MRTLSHNGFARTELHRERVYTGANCDWCGGERCTPSGKRYYLYRYSITRDDSPSRHNAHKGLFCSKSCHDAYHG